MSNDICKSYSSFAYIQICCLKVDALWLDRPINHQLVTELVRVNEPNLVPKSEIGQGSASILIVHRTVSRFRDVALLGSVPAEGGDT